MQAQLTQMLQITHHLTNKNGIIASSPTEYSHARGIGNVMSELQNRLMKRPRTRFKQAFELGIKIETKRHSYSFATMHTRSIPLRSKGHLAFQVVRHLKVYRVELYNIVSAPISPSKALVYLPACLAVVTLAFKIVHLLSRSPEARRGGSLTVGSKSYSTSRPPQASALTYIIAYQHASSLTYRLDNSSVRHLDESTSLPNFQTLSLQLTLLRGVKVRIVPSTLLHSLQAKTRRGETSPSYRLYKPIALTSKQKTLSILGIFPRIEVCNSPRKVPTAQPGICRFLSPQESLGHLSSHLPHSLVEAISLSHLVISSTCHLLIGCTAILSRSLLSMFAISWHLFQGLGGAA